MTGRTPGPWRWGGNTSGPIYLSTTGHGRIMVMAFNRLGMQDAQPCFPVWSEDAARLGLLENATAVAVREAPYRDQIADLDCSHARYLCRSWEYVEALLGEVDRLRTQLRDRDPSEVW
ncbi:MAG: hypothetical protein ACRDTM_12855 [Micromonosporaceae bacterium]